ncbi:GDSL-type esterase/lipase family protein [Streptomyces sp. NPDC048445]|uniref:GDSL-type esterase/lipase family protein n=1 Tax=Streptomyces sp. NPDC048445 TaxID=3365553 RepID=UPI0037207DDA
MSDLPPSQPPDGMTRRGLLRAATSGGALFVLASLSEVSTATAAAAASQGPALGPQDQATRDTVFQLVNRRTGKAIDVPGAATTAGTGLIQHAPSSAVNQQFLFITVGEGIDEVYTTHSPTTLGWAVWGGASDAGAKIVQWTPEHSTSQQWRRSRTADGYTVVTCVRSGKVLGVSGGSTADGAAIEQQTPDGGEGQQWRLVEKGTRVAAWAPSMTTGGQTFTNQTIRMVAHSSVAGSGVRITLSNQYSDTPLDIGAVGIAVQANGGEAEPGTSRKVAFSGSRQITIPVGGQATSDVIPISVGAGGNLLVSLYVPNPTGTSTWHCDALDTTYLAPGNHTGDEGATAFATTTTSWYYLAGMDVVSPTAEGVVVAFGDSITDGYASSRGTYNRWPDFLGRRLGAEPGGQKLSVVDAGIGGNRVLTDVPNLWQGVSALKRFRRDALDQPGVKYVILFEGINDIGNGAGPNGAPLTAQHLIDGYRTLIDEAHGAGVRIIGATLMPNGGNAYGGYNTPAAEAIRQSVNTWIRTGGAFDGVIDFDQAMRDPARPAALNPAYDSGDRLHPNDAGMKAMADAVDLSLLRN